MPLCPFFGERQQTKLDSLTNSIWTEDRLVVSRPVKNYRRADGPNTPNTLYQLQLMRMLTDEGKILKGILYTIPGLHHTLCAVYKKAWIRFYKDLFYSGSSSTSREHTHYHSRLMHRMITLKQEGVIKGISTNFTYQRLFSGLWNLYKVFCGSRGWCEKLDQLVKWCHLGQSQLGLTTTYRLLVSVWS